MQTPIQHFYRSQARCQEIVDAAAARTMTVAAAQQPSMLKRMAAFLIERCKAPALRLAGRTSIGLRFSQANEPKAKV